MFIIYTDGACDNFKSKSGSWAFVVLKNNIPIHQESGFEEKTTNNRMEYIASIKALRWAAENFGSIEAVLNTDSQLLVNTAMQWRHKWKKFSWHKGKSMKSPIINRDLVIEIDHLCDFHNVKYQWVKGHAGIKWNEYCDRLCNMELAKYGVFCR